jgi:hypothetical protein
MNDFLHRLYRLSQSTKRTPREDFLTLCVGRQIEADAEFANHLLKAIGKQVEKKSLKASIKRWRRAPESERSLEVHAQVPARTQQHERDGAVDLLIRLDGPSKVELIIEAKVGSSVPDPGQLERYAAAFPERAEGLSRAKVIGLIQKTESHRYPPGWAHITWDDVMAAIPDTDTPGLLSRSRRELLDLLAEGGVGDTRTALPSTAWSEVVEVSRIWDEKLPPRLQTMMVEMFPNKDLRRRARELIEDEEYEVYPNNAWGIGFWTGRVPRDMRIQGLTLGVEDGAFQDEVVWRLEIYPSNEALREWLRGKDAPSWWPVRSESGWFFTHLTTHSGKRDLTKTDLGEVIRLGRLALKDVHLQAGVSWHPHGTGNPPYAPRNLHIPVLRDGVRQWDTVYHGLRQLVFDLLTILGPREEGLVAYRWDEDAWRSKYRLGSIERYVHADVEVDLESLYVQITDADEATKGLVKSALDDLPAAKGLTLSFDPALCRVTWQITDATWQHASVASTLAQILQAGLQ